MKTRVMQCQKMLQLAACAVTALLVCAPSGHSAPVGGTVTDGQANISQSGALTTITQSTDRAVLNWNQFNIGAGEAVQFAQPSASSITINRILDVNPSTIDGQLSANGQLVLINPNGIVFGLGSRIDVGGLIATTSDIANTQSFMQGGALQLSIPGNPDASVINQGQITVGQAGLVGLVAPHVENQGAIVARLGTVVLASGDMHTLDMAGDGLLSIEVSDAVAEQVVKNTGSIVAEGGQVVLTAAQARDAVDALLMNSGEIAANSVGTAQGSVQVAGGGTVQLGGTIEARGDDAGEQGGHIQITGEHVALQNGALVDASGDAGGGRVEIGGEREGGGTLAHAQTTEIEENATIRANADTQGAGGNVVVWSDEQTDMHGRIETHGGAEQGVGGDIEISSKNQLNFDGTVDMHGVNAQNGTLLLDPTNIVISSAGDSNVTGASPYEPSADDATSVLSVATLQGALASGNVTVQTRATGSQPGNITVSNAVSWASGNSLTLLSHNLVSVNAAINAGAGNLTIEAADVSLSANLTGTGTLYLTPNADNITVGVGNSAVGAFNLNSTEIGKITNGWGDIVIGRQTGTAAMDVRATSWNDNLTIQSGSGVITTNGTVNVGANNLTIRTDADLVLNGNLQGSKTLTIAATTNSTSIGLAGGAGTLNLTATELGKLTNGWAGIVIGRTDGTGALEVGARSWSDPLTLQTGSGQLTISGTQTMSGNNLTLITDSDLALNGSLTGSGTLTVRGASAGTDIGLGTGQTGTLLLDDTELARLTNGWNYLIFGDAAQSGALNVGTHTWNDKLTLKTGSGILSINGNQTMAANALAIQSDADVALNANLSGTSTLTISGAANGTNIGLGTGQAGSLVLDDTELLRIQNGFSGITIGSSTMSGALNLGAASWSDPLTLRTASGIITVNGTQTMAGNALNIFSDADLTLNAGLSGTGTLTIAGNVAGTGIGLGTGQAGQLVLDNAELANLTNGWGNLVFGATNQTGALNVGNANWNDRVTFRTGSGILSINGDQTMGANSLTISTDANLALNANLNGTSTLSIAPTTASTSIGVGTGQTGILALDDAELLRIQNGFSGIFIGSTSQTGALNVGAASWNDPLTLRTGTGIISINGTQNMAANNLTLNSNANIAINADLVGTGSLTVAGSSTATSIGVGNAQAGTLLIDDSELAHVQNGWANLIFGSTSQTGTLNVGAASWNDNVALYTASGAISINGAQNMGANNLTITTNANPTINAPLSGSGTFTLSGSSAATTLALGTGQTGTVALDDGELAQLSDGWANLIFGSTSQTGTLNVGAMSWNDNVDLRTAAGLLSINGTQTMGANNLILRSNSSLAINADLIGTGTLTILPSTASTTIGVGTGQTGTLALTDTELAHIIDGWGLITLGSTGQTGAMNIGATSWNDSLKLVSSSGVITTNGTVDVGTNNLTLQTNGNPVLNGNLAGSGTLSILPTTSSTTIGLGGATGTLNLTAAELGKIADGWSSITIGSTAQTGAIGLNAATWLDPLTLISNTGTITIAGTQDFGANNFTINTNGNPAINANLNGTGTITIATTTASTSIGLAGGTGTLNLTAAELGKITNGWSDIVIGRSDGTGAINLAAASWNDNVTLKMGTGVLTVSGNQSMGANNLTIEADANPVLNANLAGSGTLTVRGSNAATTLGLGNGQTGTLNLTDAELARISAGWSQVLFGRADGTGAINIGAFTWANPTTFLAQGNIVLNGAQNSSLGAGTNLVYATTGGAFINNAGASAISAGGGRFLVYSVSSTTDTLGGLAWPTRVYSSTYAGYGPASVTETGNVFLYTASPFVLNLQIDDATVQYGDALPGFTYSYLSGLVAGDTLASAISGSTLTAAGASALDAAGTTTSITGSFTTSSDYIVNVTNGTLTRTKAPLTVIANDATRYYGDANPALSVSYSGFKNGETSAALSALPTASTLAMPSSVLGDYTIIASGAAAGNYSINYVSGTLKVLPRPGGATVVASTDVAPRVAPNNIQNATPSPQVENGAPETGGDGIAVIPAHDAQQAHAGDDYLIAITDELSAKTYGKANMYLHFSPLKRTIIKRKRHARPEAI